MRPAKNSGSTAVAVAARGVAVVDENQALESTSLVMDNRRINNALTMCGVDSRPRWITDDVYDAFRSDLAIWNYDLVPRLVTWSRFDAGYFLMGLAHRRDPFMCLQDPCLVLDCNQRNLQTTVNTIINVRICESAECERMSPQAWIAFAQQHGLKVNEDVVCEVAARCDDPSPIPGRQLHMLHKALGAALALAELDSGASVARIVEELNAKGSGLDRKRVSPHIRAALASLNPLVA